MAKKGKGYSDNINHLYSVVLALCTIENIKRGCDRTASFVDYPKV